jgi:hypothetical protein
MTYEPIAAHLAVQLVRETAWSARPDAPVVPVRAPRRARAAGARARLAADLRTVAGWVEPKARPARACQNS